uniref:Knottin scorpion toxin-like domain-containing protein n=1 Tax=Oryza punctata TaxID=4537 RepID=A0A0E0M6N4_ORYPU
MEARSLNLCFLLVFVLLLSPAPSAVAFSPEDCLDDIGWILFCTKQTCKFSCWTSRGVNKGRKMRDYWCSNSNTCHCVFCTGD